VLQLAAVVGRQFNVPVLRELLSGLPETTLREALARLSEREFVVAQPDQPDGEYLFQHVITSDAIYSTILKRDRAELHGQVGEALERLYAGRLEGQIEILARHYSWSTRLDRALHYLILAGQKAARDYANEQARQHFEQALALLPQIEHLPSQALQVRMGLGEVLAFVGEYAAAREQYRAALDEMPATDPRRYANERSGLERRLGQTYERQGNYDEALLSLAAARSALDDAPEPLPIEQAQILDDISWIHFRRGNLDDAERYLTAALALVEGTPNANVLASIYNHLGGVAFQKKNLAQASAYARQSLELREAMGDIVGVARLHNNLGLLAYAQGDWDTALENYDRNLELLTRLGDAEAMALSYLNIAILHLDLGHLDAAKTHLERSLEAARQTGAQFHLAAAHMHSGRLWIKRKDFDQAEAHLQASRRIFAEIGAKENVAEVVHLMGEVQLGRGHAQHAAELAQNSIDLIAEVTGGEPARSDEYGRALQLLGKAALAQGDWDAARRYLRESASTFESNGTQLERARSLTELGRVGAAQGDSPAARQCWEEARRVFQALKAGAEAQAVVELLDALPVS
jgi:tetratricopeptide (TPR) repeat protein